MQPSRLAIIANPSSGAGAGKRILREARSRLWGYDLSIVLPTSPTQLSEICAGLSPQEFKAAIIVGGDGTMSCAIRGLAESGVPLYPFPAGTANDLAHELGVGADWNQVQFLLDESEPTAIDLIEVNGRLFVTVAGIGLGAVVTQEFNEMRKNSRVLKALYRSTQEHMYSALVAKNILWNARSLYKLKISAETFHDTIETTAFSICNQAALGGNFKIAPEANNRDGKFEVVFFKHGTTLDFARFTMDVVRGRFPHRSLRLSTRRLSIQEVNHKPITLFADGEILLSAPNLDFKIHEKSLRVYRALPNLPTRIELASTQSAEI